MSFSDDRECPYCRAQAVGGYEGCQEVLHALTTRVYTEYGGLIAYPDYRATIDCYCLQHPEFYCESAKSYAAHLTGMCCWIEFGGKEEVNAAVRRWLDGSRILTKPPVPQFRGELTILYLKEAENSADFDLRLDAWAHSIWAAYFDLHETARAYIRAAY